MRTRPPGSPRRLLLALVAVIATFVGAGAFAGSANAAPPDNGWTCRSQSLIVELAGQSPLQPVTNLLGAGSDDATCATGGGVLTDQGLNPILTILQPLGVDLGLLSTTTTTDSTKPPRKQTPVSYAKVAGLNIGLLGLTLPGLSSLVQVDAVETSVTGKCDSGSPSFSSTVNVGEVTVLGQKIDLNQPVTTLTRGLNGLLEVVVRITKGSETATATGDKMRGLRIEVATRLLGGLVETSLADLSVATSNVDAHGLACADAALPTVGAPTLDGRTIHADVTPPTGGDIASCSFSVAAKPDGTLKTVDGEYADGVCKADLSPADFPPGDYSGTASAKTTGSDPGTATSAASDLTITGPTVGDPVVDGRDVTVPVAPGAGATVTDCKITITPKAGGDPIELTATYADGACKATIPDGVQPGDYTVATTVTDSDHQQGTGSGDATVVAPTVGVPTIDERTATATVTPADGTTIASCGFVLTPAGGGDPITVPGAPSTGACTATIPDAVAEGDYDIVVKATDNHDTSTTNTGTGTVENPAPATHVEVGTPTIDGRTVTTPVTVPDGQTVTKCALSVTPKAGGAVKPVPGTYADGACKADLPAADFPPGGYDVTVTVTDGNSATFDGTGPVTIAGPTVGAPVLDGRDITVPVTPGAGATVEECTITITPTGGTAKALTASYDADKDACVATIPSDVQPGAYEVATTVKDSDGSTGEGTGTITLAAPTVGVPTISGRTVTANVTPAEGTTIGTCKFDVTLTGGTAKTVTGTFAAGKCTATLPAADFPVGDYGIVATAVDSAGVTTTNSGNGTISDSPAGPEITVGTPTIDGRDVSAPVTVPDGQTAESCKVTVTPKAGGTAIVLDGTLKDGKCVATLPREQFPPGDYDVVVTVTDGDGRPVTGDGPVTVAGPTVGTPVVVGPVVVVPVTPGPGATVTECSLQVTPAGGGAAKTVAGVYDAATGTCTAILSSETFPSGDYSIVTTVKDSYGDTGSGIAKVTITQFTTGGSGGTGTGTGGGSGTGTSAGDVAQSLLACEGGQAALIDTRISGSRVRVSGVALPTLAGKTVLVRLSVKGKGLRTVAQTTVAKDGQFAATAKIPSKADRKTTARAKYVAQIGDTRSGSLRLTRRTRLSSVTTSGGRITIKGRVTAPYPKAGTAVSVGQRVSCTSYRTVGKAKTTKSGRFTVSFKATKGAAGLYRVDTKVPSKPKQPARNRTYSLPRIVTAR